MKALEKKFRSLMQEEYRRRMELVQKHAEDTGLRLEGDNLDEVLNEDGEYHSIVKEIDDFLDDYYDLHKSWDELYHRLRSLERHCYEELGGLAKALEGQYFASDYYCDFKEVYEGMIKAGEIDEFYEYDFDQ